MPTITENIQLVCERIEKIKLRYQRSDETVKLLAVSKTQGIDKITQAYEAGLRDFGENFLQDALLKIQSLSSLNLCWHFIGPIQSNKTRDIARHFDWVHSVDRIKIAKRLNDQRPDSTPPLNVCIQVNHSREASKSGILLSEVPALCQQIENLKHLKLRGLMSIPAPATDFDQQRAIFRPLADLFNQLREDHQTLDTLSIGMSADFEAAIAEGSTLVRVGTGIFGPRTPRSHVAESG